MCNLNGLALEVSICCRVVPACNCPDVIAITAPHKLIRDLLDLFVRLLVAALKVDPCA